LAEGTGGGTFTEEVAAEILKEGEEHGCPGFKEGSIPLADPGKLCVYAAETLGVAPTGTPQPLTVRTSGEPQIYLGGGRIPRPPSNSGTKKGVNQVGTTLGMSCSESSCSGIGVWAVTAE
jgi:hypothetical protein